MANEDGIRAAVAHLEHGLGAPSSSANPLLEKLLSS
jgi:hypothetical protein